MRVVCMSNNTCYQLTKMPCAIYRARVRTTHTHNFTTKDCALRIVIAVYNRSLQHMQPVPRKNSEEERERDRERCQCECELNLMSNACIARAYTSDVRERIPLRNQRVRCKRLVVNAEPPLRCSVACILSTPFAACCALASSLRRFVCTVCSILKASKLGYPRRPAATMPIFCKTYIWIFIIFSSVPMCLHPKLVYTRIYLVNIRELCEVIVPL